MSSNQAPHSNMATCAIISCTSNEFNDLFNDTNISTDTLCNDVLRNVIIRNRERLREDKLDYRLDDLLIAMLEKAPHPLGKRYVAVALHIAQEKGVETVVDLANAWMEQLFFPMWTISKAYRSNLYNGQDPPFPHGTDTTDFKFLNELKCSEKSLKVQLGIRERHYCPISRTFDIEVVQSLTMQKRSKEIPPVNYQYMTPVPIIPFLLNSDGSCTICGVKIRDSGCTRKMIQSWTGINIEDEVGSTWNIYSARNAIHMAFGTNLCFQNFLIYLDKEAFPATPNKYKIRQICSPALAGVILGDITFPTLAESSIDPPSSRLLGIHASLGQVLDACGADPYVYKLEEKAVRYQQSLDDLLCREIKVENGATIHGSTPVIL